MISEASTQGADTTFTRVCELLARAIGLLLIVVVTSGAQAAELLLLASDSSALYEGFAKTFKFELERPTATSETPSIDLLFLNRIEQDGLPDVGNYDLVITIGTRAASALVSHESSPKAVLYTLLPASVFRKLETDEQTCARHSAIFIDQPITRQIRLAEILFPQARKFGVLLGPTSKQRRPEIDHYRETGNNELVVRVVEKEAELARTSMNLLDDSDLVIAVSDPLALNRKNARWLLYAAYQRQLPIIGFSRAYVKAGAAAAVFSDPQQMAREAADTVFDWLESDQSCLPKPGYSRHFSISINSPVFNSLGGKRVDERAVMRQLRRQESR